MKDVVAVVVAATAFLSAVSTLVHEVKEPVKELTRCATIGCVNAAN